MVRKDCPKCGKPSFSSSSSGMWKCPECQYDLTKEEIKNV